jgi:tRNA (guanine-N7-)-methyltransferase
LGNSPWIFIIMGRKLSTLDVTGIGIDPDQLPAVVDLASLFPETIGGKITEEELPRFEIEIGTGKGTFLLRAAKANPQTCYLGIEWASKYYRYAADRIRRWGLNNVKIIRTEAASFIRERIKSESVDVFHVYFPDPWPKKRHHKRRLIQPATVADFARALKVPGRLHVVTDHKEYFSEIASLVDSSPHFDRREFEASLNLDAGEWVSTNFEKKYSAEGREIQGLTAVRIR